MFNPCFEQVDCSSVPGSPGGLYPVSLPILSIVFQSGVCLFLHRNLVLMVTVCRVYASFLPRIVDSLVSLLQSGADREPEIIEQV